MFKLLFKLVKLVIFLVSLPFVWVAALALFRVGPAPQIDIQSSRPGIGRQTAVLVKVSEPSRGLGTIKVELLQEERTEMLATKTHRPRRFWSFWGDKQAAEELSVNVGRDAFPKLRPGEATIRVTASRAGTWLRHPEPVVQELTLPVRFIPPTIERVAREVYLAQGGSEVVVYRVGETSVRDGVQAGDWFFPGFPLPGGGARDRMALFAMPYDLADMSKVRITAADELGNVASLQCLDKFFPKPFKEDTIPVDDTFMGKVVSEIVSRTPELQEKPTLLESYLMLNRDLRKTNAEKLKALAKDSRPEFLWRRTFLPIANAAVRSSFADRRTYMYQGKAVDQQDHLGFDMASVQQAPISSVNDGVVVLAEYFGIYGNAVVIDHGYGLMSLYGHLSSIAVQPGQTVERGGLLGQSGKTGLAGGDHLHFAMLLQGLAVNPIEWWDEHWIRDRLARKLGGAFPFEPGAPASAARRKK
jgi:murein DD-endopeptidase MepM/ murein hydrolase activator NlpD